MEYYESRLNPEEHAFYKAIVSALKRRAAFVKGHHITDVDTLLKCVEAVEYDCPELFYVNFRHIQYVMFPSGWEYRPEYLYKKKETEKRKKQLSEEVDRIVSLIRQKNLKSVYAVCGAVHDYFVRNCVYDWEALDDQSLRPTAFTIEGPLLSHKAVCQGISFAYRLVCYRFGIEAISVKGLSMLKGPGNWEPHSWNMIRANGQTAQMDTTWDMNLTKEDGPVRYDYFFLPDIEMMRDHQYVGYPLCRKIRMSYFERAGTCFETNEQLKAYIGKILCGDGNKYQTGVYWLYFKMVNRKDTIESINSFIVGQITANTLKSCRYEYSVNTPQSAFIYRIDFGSK